jgi:NAD(P)-dependent dehydrogenase (short-subunit alcohol dehydrogenase family)
VTDEGQVAATVDAAAALGPVDAVFANAGVVGVTGRIEDTALVDFRRTTDLLLTSVFLTVKHAVRVMRPHGRGAIVCTASVASLRGGLGPHAYTAAKHAVKGLVESVAVEVAPYGLRINAVAPGGTVSSLSAGLMGDVDDLATPYRRLAAASSSGVPTTAADVADAALFLAAAARVNGACLVVDGGDDVLASRGRAYYG